MKKIRKLLVIPIYLYQACISPFLGRNCRFEPTCSQYCKEAILTHGFFLGSLLSLKRIMKCHPFGGFGYDPVPKKETKK